MKKIYLLLLSIFIGTGIMNAQTDCVEFFPANEGTVLVTKTYDQGNRLLNSMIYRVNRVSSGMSMNDMQIGFTLMDAYNNAVSNATIDASCTNGFFNMKMVSKGYSPDVVKAMTTNTELIGYFLNYPNTLNTDPMSMNNSPFTMEGGEYTIEDNSDKKDKITVRVNNRQLEGMERVITPARNDSFNSYKITFNFDVMQNNRTTKLKGIQWYSPRFGIVKSETYDNNNNLINRTELTTIQEM